MYTDITKIGVPVWIEVDICLSLVDFWHFVLIFLFVSLRFSYLFNKNNYIC